MLSLDPTWIAEVSRSGAKPCFLATIEIGPAGYLTVISAAAGAGQTLTITTNEGTRTLTEGVDFNRGANSAVCAQNIAAAFSPLGLPDTNTGMVAGAFGIRVDFYPGNAGITFVTVASGNTAAWIASPTALPRNVQFVTGDEVVAGAFNSLSEVKPTANRMDVLTRQIAVGGCELEFVDDGVLRSYLTRSRPKGKKVTLTIGVPSISVGAFAPVGVYVIDDWVPEPGKIIVRCAEAASYWLDNTVGGNYICMHPLAIIRRVLNQIAFPTQFWDDTTLESTAGQYSTISHWATIMSGFYPTRNLPVVANSSNGPLAAMKARDVITEMSKLLYGGFNPGEDGIYRMQVYNPSATVVRNLTDDDIDGWDPETTATNIYNNVAVTGWAGFIVTGTAQQGGALPLFTIRDAAAAIANGVLGQARDFVSVVTSQWIGIPTIIVFGQFSTGTLGQADTLLSIQPCVLGGVSGTRQSSNATPDGSGGFAVPSQRAADQVNPGAGRVGYLLITNGGNFEYVQVTNWDFTTPSTAASAEPLANGYIDRVSMTSALSAGSIFFEPGFSNPDGFAYLKGTATATIVRGMFGTTPRFWGNAAAGTRIFDVTIPVALAQQLLLRFKWGVPVVKVRTGLQHWDLQLGDFVTVTDDVYVAFQHDGADTLTTWEIISKEIHALDDQPFIEFILAFVGDNFPPPSVPTYPAPPGSGGGGGPPGANDVITTSTLVNVTDSNGNLLTQV